MRKRLTAAAAVAAITVSGLLFASAPAALADTSYCVSNPPDYICEVQQATAAGYASAYATFDGDTGNSWGTFGNYSGYSMSAWVEIDYGNGPVLVWGPVSMPYDPDGDSRTSPPFDDSGYLTYSCFQFTSWTGAAVHCTPQGV
jgi:hypothetical protein